MPDDRSRRFYVSVLEVIRYVDDRSSWYPSTWYQMKDDVGKMLSTSRNEISPAKEKIPLADRLNGVS